MENYVASSTEELLSIARSGFKEIGYQMLNKLGAPPLDWNQPLKQPIAPLMRFISDS
jgi:hypothetical protein